MEVYLLTAIIPSAFNTRLLQV